MVTNPPSLPKYKVLESLENSKTIGGGVRCTSEVPDGSRDRNS